MQNFNYSNNPIHYIPPNINRILNRIKNHQNIYNDSQNIHNNDIQKCIIKSINNIIQIKPTIIIEDYLIQNNILTEQTKQLLFEYINNNEVHSILNITFKELLEIIITIIETKSNKNDILEILNDEITDSNCKCFTGRLTRLINCLNGNDDRIIINISDKEQIGNIIILIKNNMENYTIEEHKILVKNELTQHGFDENIIKEYINYIE